MGEEFNILDDGLIAELISLLDPVGVVTDSDILASVSVDETPELSAMPAALVRAKSAEDVATVLKFATEHRIPVTPRGGGTSVVGGAVPYPGGIVLSLERMNRIIEIDTSSLTATLEPGVTTSDLDKATAEQGLFYPPDPGSVDTCTIGGNFATNAGGMTAVRYGVTKDYILGAEVVLPDGSMLKLGGKLRKDVAGYNILGLLVGSEGTLAIATKIIVKLAHRPEHQILLLAGFKTLDEALATVPSLMGLEPLPTAIEFMDSDTIKLVEQALKKDIPLGNAGALLLLRFDGNDADYLENTVFAAGEMLMDAGAYDVKLATQKPMQEHLWEVRRGIRESLRMISPIIMAEDVAVPVNRLVELVSGVKDIARANGVKIVAFGHSGDGNVHIDLLKESLSDEEWERVVPISVEQILSLAISLGGTLTGEHGIGLTKKKYLSLQFTEREIELMKSLKKLFDPAGILNPGKIFL